MKKIFDNLRSKVKQSWQNLMRSRHEKLSAGAENITRMMPSAHKENWRRHEEKKHKKD